MTHGGVVVTQLMFRLPLPHSLNSEVAITPHHLLLDSNNAMNIIKKYVYPVSSIQCKLQYTALMYVK